MVSSVSSLRPRAARRSRAWGFGAATAVLVFFGTAAMAPFSMPPAFAAEGSAASFATGRGAAGSEGREARGADAGEAQMLVSTRSAEPGVDPSLATVRLESGSTSADAGDGAGTAATASEALYTLQEFMFSGVVEWGGYRFTYYSQRVLPGGGLQVPGRHVNAGGYVSDGDGYIVLAGSAPKGTVFETPFGHPGKIYDRGTYGNHLDVYIR